MPDRYEGLCIYEGFLDVCYSFIKMAQDNTCSYTIGMNSHHIFMPINILLDWLVTQVMFAPVCPSYKMLNYTHVYMIFEFFFKGS